VAKIARDLDVSPETLRKWVNQPRSTPESAKGSPLRNAGAEEVEQRGEGPKGGA
jgi:transposase-like protein